MKISVSINTSAEAGENISYESISFSLGGFDKNVSIRDLAGAIIDWVKEKIGESLKMKIKE